MHSSGRIILSIIAFITLFLIVVFGAYATGLLDLNPETTTASHVALSVAFIAVAAFLLPVLFLKGISLLSRKVNHDGSHFNVKDIPDDQVRPHRKYTH